MAEADTHTNDGGGSVRMLRSMIAQGREFVAVSDDSDDRAAMEAILVKLTNLLAVEAGEDDSTVTVEAVNAATGKSTTRRLLLVKQDSAARWSRAAQLVMDRELDAELDAEHRLETEHGELEMTDDERRAALKSERDAINAELVQLSGIDPVEQDRQALAILSQFGPLGSEIEHVRKRVDRDDA